MPVDASEAGDDVHRIAGLDLQEVLVVDQCGDHVADVVALGPLHRDDLAQSRVRLDVVVREEHRRLLGVVLRQEAQDLLRDEQRLLVGVGDEVRDAGDRLVGVCAAKFVLGDDLTGDLLDDFGPGDEHVGLAGLDDEVGQGRAVDRATGARPGDDRDLRHDTRQLDVGEEDLAVARQRVDALLDAGATGVIDEDERSAVHQRALHRLGDLDVVRLAGRAAHDGEVLAGDVDRASHHRRVAGDHAVGGHVRLVHSEGGGPVLPEGAGLDEGARIGEGVDALARRQLPLLVLLLDARLATTSLNPLTLLIEVREALFHGVLFGHYWCISLRPALRRRCDSRR